MTTPSPTDPAEPDPVQVDPRMVLAKIEGRGELGAALVYGAHMAVLAEHYAAECGRLRDAAAADPPPAT